MKNKIAKFEDLEIWQKAASISIEIFTISENSKIKNDFGTKDQIRRSAFAISNNIAEGFEYSNTNDFIRFLRIAEGSAGEPRS